MPALLIHGENEYQAQSRLGELINEFLSKNNPESLRVFDGEDSDATEVAQAVAAQSLFTSGHEMVIIKRLGTNTQLKEQLADNLSNLSDTTEFIIYDPKIDKIADIESGEFDFSQPSAIGGPDNIPEKLTADEVTESRCSSTGSITCKVT